MGSSVQQPPALLRRATVAAVSLVTLIAGVAFSIRGGSGTTTFIDYKREVVTCTATGGLAKYAYCNWQEPITDAGSGSVLTGLYFSVGRSPKVIGIDFTVGPSATVSGAIVPFNLSDVQTGTGRTFVNLTGALLISSGNYLRLVTLTDPTAAHTASLMVEYYTRLSR